jgi:hypothetical protein
MCCPGLKVSSDTVVVPGEKQGDRRRPVGRVQHVQQQKLRQKEVGRGSARYSSSWFSTTDLCRKTLGVCRVKRPSDSCQRVDSAADVAADLHLPTSSSLCVRTQQN